MMKIKFDIILFFIYLILIAKLFLLLIRLYFLFEIKYLLLK